MMHRRCELALALVLGATGCNAVFGLGPTILVDANDDDAAVEAADRDRDGIPDPEDSCIAGIADYKTDLDYDGPPNETDPCPFDFDASNVDADGDGIYDECDPLWQLGGDRRRCFMGFQSPTINIELWEPRGDASVWRLYDRSGLIAASTGTIVARESFEAPVATSYDLVVYVTPPAAEAAVTLWLRTTGTASPGDVGCELRGTTASTTLAMKGGAAAPIGFTRSIATTLKLQATISPGTAPGTANVRCAVRFLSMFPPAGISAEVTLPPGRVGFAVEGTRAIFAALLILERDTPPTL